MGEPSELDDDDELWCDTMILAPLTIEGRVSVTLFAMAAARGLTAADNDDVGIGETADVGRTSPSVD